MKVKPQKVGSPQPLRSGFLFVDKEVGPTSHDIVNDLRKITGFRRIGHAGTLDPFASGILIVAIGRLATKNLANLLGLDKKYIGTVHLGASSDTDDSTGQITEHQDADPPSKEAIQAAVDTFLGGVLQKPPTYSAKRIDGKKMYQLARAGKPAEREAEWVMIYDIELLDYTWPYVKIATHTGSGVYLRAIARDLGEKLGTGGYLEHLDRNAVGPFDKSMSVKVADVTGENWHSLTHPWEHLREMLAGRKMGGAKTVLAFGTFDRFHLGHHFFLSEAAKLGNNLVVAVARDENVKHYKNKTAAQDETARRAHITSLGMVGSVIFDNAPGDFSILDDVKPDMIALGFDQRGEFEESLKKALAERKMKTKLIHLKPFKPEMYSSSASAVL
ncbi:MAG: tRNA pseudouridine(55) synthase TruB [bacterium]|nr:tRNA pseudouridine(55) synthase TruB [bacterium]